MTGAIGRLGGRQALLLIVVAGVALRLLAVASPGLPSDMRTFAQWAEGIARSGPDGYYPAGGTANYPPVLYLLWPLGRAFDGELLRDAIQALSIPFDVGMGLLLYWIGTRHGGTRQGLWAAALYLLNPAVIVAGPLWGQLDVLGALPMLASIAALSVGRYGLAAVLAVVAGLVKAQFGIAALLLAVVVLPTARKPEGVRNIAVAAVAGGLTFAAVLVPLHLGARSYLALIQRFLDAHHDGSSFALNPWALFGGFLNDEGPWFLVGATSMLVAIVGALLLLRRRRDLVGLLAVGFLIGLALYLLPTRVHDRYLFGALVLLAPLAGLHAPLRVPFAVLSAIFTIDLLYVLAYAGTFGPLGLGSDPGRLPIAAGVLAMLGAAGWCIWRVKPLSEPRGEPVGA